MSSAAHFQPRRRSVWLAHMQLPAYAAYTVFLVGRHFVPDRPVVVILDVALLCFVFATCVGAYRHQAVLCMRCAAEFPADGSEQAEHRLRVLRHFHDDRIRRRAIIPLIAVYAAAAWLSDWFFVLWWAIFLVELWMVQIHRRLEPWCPWCRRRDDGGHSPVQPPVPTGEASR